MRRRAFGLRPMPTLSSRPFGVNPSRLRACGAARCACNKKWPRQKAVQVTLRLSLLRQVARKRAVLDAGSSLSGRHEGRFTDTPPDLAYGVFTPRLSSSATASGGSVCAHHWEAESCPRQDSCRCSRLAEKPSPATLLCRTVGLCVLVLS